MPDVVRPEDVVMSDGTVIKDVPKGTTQAELQRRYAIFSGANAASVDEAAVSRASKSLTPEIVKLPFNPPKFGPAGNELFVELVKEPGETTGQLFTRSLQDGSITTDMIPEEMQGSFVSDDPSVNPRTGQAPISNLESFLARTGQQQTQNVQGLDTLLSGSSDERLARNQAGLATDQQNLAPSSEQNPIADFLGSMAGNILPVPGGPVMQGGMGVIQGIVNRIGGGERPTLKNAALDAVLSAGASKLAGPRAPGRPIDAPTPSALARQQTKLLKARKVTLSPAEKSKGKLTGVLERALEPGLDTTPTGRIATEFRGARQQQQINREITGFFTSPRKVFNISTINRVSNEIGQEFDDALSGSAIGFERLSSVANNARRSFAQDPSGVKPSNEVFKIVNRFVKNNDGGISGEQYGSIRSKWLKKWRDWSKNADRATDAEAIGDLISLYDEAFQDSVAPINAARYADVRKRWNMFRLTREATDVKSGRISSPRLANKISRKGETSVPREFRDLVEAAANITQPILGQSGTGPRIGLQQLLLDANNNRGAAAVSLLALPTMSLINSGTPASSLAAAFGRGVNPAVRASGLLRNEEEQGLVGP